MLTGIGIGIDKAVRDKIEIFSDGQWSGTTPSGGCGNTGGSGAQATVGSGNTYCWLR